MLEKLKAVEYRFEELCAKSEQPDFYADPKQAARLLREKNDLEPIVTCYRAYHDAVREQEEAQELMSDPEMREFCQQTFQEQEEAQELMSDPEMREFCQQTFQEAKQRQEELYRQLQLLLLPKDPNDDKNVIVEIRGGVGGEERTRKCGNSASRPFRRPSSGRRNCTASFSFCCCPKIPTTIKM